MDLLSFFLHQWIIGWGVGELVVKKNLVEQLDRGLIKGRALDTQETHILTMAMVADFWSLFFGHYCHFCSNFSTVPGQAR